jgi:hypothetical protein
MLALAGLAVSLSAAVRAQRRTPVIGILGSGYPEDPTIALNLSMFARGLRQEGFVDGQNVRSNIDGRTTGRIDWPVSRRSWSRSRST